MLKLTVISVQEFDTKQYNPLLSYKSKLGWRLASAAPFEIQFAYCHIF